MNCTDVILILKNYQKLHQIKLFLKDDLDRIVWRYGTLGHKCRTNKYKRTTDYCYSIFVEKKRSQNLSENRTSVSESDLSRMKCAWSRESLGMSAQNTWCSWLTTANQSATVTSSNIAGTGLRPTLSSKPCVSARSTCRVSHSTNADELSDSLRRLNIGTDADSATLAPEPDDTAGVPASVSAELADWPVLTCRDLR